MIEKHSVAEAPTPPVTQGRARGILSSATFTSAAPRPVPAPRAPQRRMRPSREAFQDVAVAFEGARSEAAAEEDDEAKSEMTATASFAKSTQTFD